MSDVTQLTSEHPPAFPDGSGGAGCLCYRNYGGAKCYRGHGYCPFLESDAKRLGTTWRRLLARQARLFREDGWKWIPLVGWRRS